MALSVGLRMSAFLPLLGQTHEPPSSGPRSGEKHAASSAAT
jgi:hypothetical protein